MSRHEPPDNRAPFHMEVVRQRLDQLEMKLQLLVAEVIKLRDQVRVLRGAPRGSVVDPNSESYTISQTKESKSDG